MAIGRVRVVKHTTVRRPVVAIRRPSGISKAGRREATPNGGRIGNGANSR
jgi:hypothetical protein